MEIVDAACDFFLIWVFPPLDDLAQTICGNLLSQSCYVVVPDKPHKCTYLPTSLAHDV